MDPHIARAPIVLGKEGSDEGDPVVRWIRTEFTNIDAVRGARARNSCNLAAICSDSKSAHRVDAADLRPDADANHAISKPV